MGPSLHISWMSFFICGDLTEAAYSGFTFILGQAKAYNDPPVFVFTTFYGRLWNILRSLCPRICSGFWTLATCQLFLSSEVLVGPRWWVWCCMVHSESPLDSLAALLWTPSIRTAMNKTEHGVRQVFGKLEVILKSNIQIFFWGNLVEVHPALPWSHLVNVFVVVVSYVHCLTFCYIKSEFPSALPLV